MFKPLLLAASLALAVTPSLADEVNVYTSRQPDLIQPIFDAFTATSGITVNVLYSEKGLIERLKAILLTFGLISRMTRVSPSPLL